MRKTREARPQRKICYLEPQKVSERRDRSHTASSTPGEFTSRARTSPPSSSSSSISFASPFSHLLLLLLLLSISRQRKHTRLLEKSARLPRALINLHSARREQRRRDTSRVTTRVTRINVSAIECRAVNLVNSCNVRRGANGAF